MDQRIKVMVFDSGRTDYSCWGNVDFPSNAEALKARDALAKVLRAEGAIIKRRTLTNQVRPYASLGCPDGAVGNVYQITVIRQEGETMATYQQLEAQRDLIERRLIEAKREVDRLETARQAVHGRIWKLIHNGALGPIKEG